MKSSAILSLILIPLVLCAGPITQKPLDEFVIYDIPVASESGTTTIMFPSEISGLYSKSVSIQEQENAGFLISFTPGNFYFSIRALKPDAEDHLTVIFNRKAYVLHLKASDRPFYNVTFYQDQRTGKDGNRIAIVPERLLSLMDKAKAYPLFVKNHPDALSDSSTTRPSSTPKPPPPIPQAIFATREVARSESYLPFGRLLRCELVNTVDSTNIETPIIGLITEEVWHDGRLIIPAGTEVHGIAQKTAARKRIGSERKWVLVFQDGRELPLSGTVLDYAPDAAKSGGWSETDGSAGLRGYMIASDKFAEAKAVLAAMISAGAGAFPQTTNLISPLTGGATQIQNGGFTDAISAGIQAGGQIYSQRLLESLKNDPYYVRVPAGTLFYLYVTQTVDLQKATTGLSASNPTNP